MVGILNAIVRDAKIQQKMGPCRLQWNVNNAKGKQ